MVIRVLFARGLRVFLDLDPELEVITSEAANGEEALCMARQLKPDIVLIDLMMPGMDGIMATEIIRRELPQTEVVITYMRHLPVSGRSSQERASWRYKPAQVNIPIWMARMHA